MSSKFFVPATSFQMMSSKGHVVRRQTFPFSPVCSQASPILSYAHAVWVSPQISNTAFFQQLPVAFESLFMKQFPSEDELLLFIQLGNPSEFKTWTLLFFTNLDLNQPIHMEVPFLTRWQINDASSSWSIVLFICKWKSLDQMTSEDLSKPRAL